MNYEGLCKNLMIALFEFFGGNSFANFHGILSRNGCIIIQFIITLLSVEMGFMKKVELYLVFTD